MRESQEGLALALAHQLSGLDPSSAPALALLHVGRYLGRQLSLLSGHSPLPLHLLPLFVVRRTVDDVSHDVDSFVVTHLEMFPVLALGGERGRAELAEKLDHLAVLLDVFLPGKY